MQSDASVISCLNTFVFLNFSLYFLAIFFFFFHVFHCLLMLITPRCHTIFAFMRIQTGSWSQLPATAITWNRYSFQMIGLNVLFYMLWKALFATHVANTWCCLYDSPIWPFSNGNHLLTSCHHWLHLFIQFVQVCTSRWIWDWYCFWSSLQITCIRNLMIIWVGGFCRQFFALNNIRFFWQI